MASLTAAFNDRFLSVISIPSVIVLWEVLCRGLNIDPFFLPPPSIIALELGSLTLSGDLLEHLVISMQRMFLAYSLSVVAGILAGLSMAWFKKVGAYATPLVNAVFPLPKVALIPLLIIWLGLGEASKIAVIFAAAFFPILYNTIGGINDVDQGVIMAARNLGATNTQILRKILLPAALPVIFVGLRLSLGVSLILLVSAEMVAAKSGLGYFLIDAGRLLMTERVFAGLVVFASLGLILFSAVDLIQRIVMPWHQSSLRGL